MGTVELSRFRFFHATGSLRHRNSHSTSQIGFHFCYCWMEIANLSTDVPSGGVGGSVRFGGRRDGVRRRRQKSESRTKGLIRLDGNNGNVAFHRPIER